MKTIAISMDEETLKGIDRLCVRLRSRSRSEVFRQAARSFLVAEEQALRETEEREIFRRHRERLGRQAAALVKGQAKP